MAHRFCCPKCGRVLEEEGDQTKLAQGEYRVFDSAGNSKHSAGSFRIIMCMVCREIGPIGYFDKAPPRPLEEIRTDPRRGDKITTPEYTLKVTGRQGAYVQ